MTPLRDDWSSSVDQHDLTTALQPDRRVGMVQRTNAAQAAAPSACCATPAPAVR